MSRGKILLLRLFGITEHWQVFSPAGVPRDVQGKDPHGVGAGAASSVLGVLLLPDGCRSLPGWVFGFSCWGQQVGGSSALRNEESAAPSSLPGTALWDKLSLINLLLSRDHLCYKLIR